MSSLQTKRTYDHGLIALVRETGDVALATRNGVPRSTAAGWLRPSPLDIVTHATVDASATEFRVRVAKVGRRISRLPAFLHNRPARFPNANGVALFGRTRVASFGRALTQTRAL